MNNKDTEHYFDWAATSPSDEEILSNCLKISIENWGNPSSIYSLGTKSKSILEEARKKCAEVLGVNEKFLYFTSGGTESDHIPLVSLLNKPQKGEILFSSIEHPAVKEMASQLKKCGFEPKEIPVNKEGIITASAVQNMLTEKTLMVFVMAVNNETGAIQPIYEIADTITNFYKGKRKAKFHVDCVQAAGKIILNIKHIGIDSASFSAHKISGPRGIGLLYLKDEVEPFLKGGGQEKGVRSGTENVFGALCLSQVLEKYCIYEKNELMIKRLETQKKLCDDFVLRLSKIKTCTIIPEARLEKKENYSAWIVQASFKNIPGQVMLRALDAEGFYISTGSACSSKKHNRPVLDAMKIPKEISENAVRFSFGHTTTEKAMNELAQKIEEICNHFE